MSENSKANITFTDSAWVGGYDINRTHCYFQCTEHVSVGQLLVDCKLGIMWF